MNYIRRGSMLTRIIPAILFLCSAAFAEVEAEGDSVAFQYGIIGRARDRPDSLFEVTDNSVLRSGDLLSIRYELIQGEHFYVVLKMSNGEYHVFYSSATAPITENGPYQPVPENWLPLDDNPGTETICLISSHEALAQLDTTYRSYQQSRGERRAELGRSLSDVISSVTDAETTESHLPLARLRQRGCVGRIFRGPVSEEDPDTQLFCECRGKAVASDVIRIIHE